jgi:hypothetical protein
VIRPSQNDFDKLVSILLSGGDWVRGQGWGGPKLKFGGYYGAGTIQGLASYYYGHIERNRSIELNRCYYNTMVDSPYHIQNNISRCRTLESTCEDCRATALEKIYNAHFTVCGKPEWCDIIQEERLCLELFGQWHRVRRSLESEWMTKYPPYSPRYEWSNSKSTSRYGVALALRQGHCRKERAYVPMEFPNVGSDLI